MSYSCKQLCWHRWIYIAKISSDGLYPQKHGRGNAITRHRQYMQMTSLSPCLSIYTGAVNCWTVKVTSRFGRRNYRMTHPWCFSRWHWHVGGASRWHWHRDGGGLVVWQWKATGWRVICWLDDWLRHLQRWDNGISFIILFTCLPQPVNMQKQSY